MNRQNEWPKHSIWPKPLNPSFASPWFLDTAMLCDLDEYGEELRDIKEYFDDLVSEGILNENYEVIEETLDEEDLPFIPEQGEEFWTDRFEEELWEEEFLEHVSKLKLDDTPLDQDPILFIRDAIHYEFINENLLRQAFTRQSFASEYGLSASNEQLEFYGDTILNTIVTRQLYDHYSSQNIDDTASPFHSELREGELSRIREHFCSRDHLSTRAKQLGFDKLVLCGREETVSDSVMEDVMEALLGAAAVDCGWDWNILEEITDRLVLLQFDNAEMILRKSSFEEFNTWYQKHFSKMPDYEIIPVFRSGRPVAFRCSLKFDMPKNDKGVPLYQRIETERETRSRARESAAEQAIMFIRSKGLWMRLDDAIKEPVYEDSINQLQELYQKRYIDKPEYEFEYDEYMKRWKCHCVCGCFEGFGSGAGKVPAKKTASYMVLIRILESSGITNPKWNKNLYDKYL